MKRLILVALILLSVAATASAADFTKTIAVNGVQRSYIVHTPPGMNAGQTWPLVVVLHGGGGNAAITARQTHFSDEADRSGFIVVYPNGSEQARPLLNAMGKPGLLTWNAGACCGYAMQNTIDDVAFIRAVVAQVSRDFAIDAKRIYATGISNGGMMAYRMACEASDVFAAIGPVAAVQVTLACNPRQHVSVIHFHGTADQNVPIAGGIGAKALEKDSRPPVQKVIEFWLRQDRCTGQPTVVRYDTVNLFDYGGCAGHTGVALYIIDGGGHSWPGGDRLAAFLDPPSPYIDATAAIWRFFAAHPKP